MQKVLNYLKKHGHGPGSEITVGLELPFDLVRGHVALHASFAEKSQYSARGINCDDEAMRPRCRSTGYRPPASACRKPGARVAQTV